jgi:hypothetical protein
MMPATPMLGFVFMIRLLLYVHHNQRGGAEPSVEKSTPKWV